MNLQQARHLAQKILAQEASQEEKSALHKYLVHNAHHPGLSELLFPLQELTQLPEQALPPDMEKRMLHNFTNKANYKRSAKLRKLKHLSIAATLLTALCLVAYSLITPSVEKFNTMTIPVGTFKELVLPDGTHIRLNGGTQLRYPATFSKNTRELYLDGEALFVVSQDDKLPFIIHTPDLTTTVLGTSFNIRSSTRQALSEVAVATGKVRVSVTGQNAADAVTDLLPGEKVKYQKGGPVTLYKEKVAISTIGAWKNHCFYYDQTPLSEILLDLEHTYGLHFLVKNPAVLKCTYSVTFKSMTSNEILQTLSLMSQVVFHSKDNLIEVSGQSCN